MNGFVISDDHSAAGRACFGEEPDKAWKSAAKSRSAGVKEEHCTQEPLS